MCEIGGGRGANLRGVSELVVTAGDWDSILSGPSEDLGGMLRISPLQVGRGHNRLVLTIPGQKASSSCAARPGAMPSYPCRASCLGKSWGSKASQEDMRWGSRGACHCVPLRRPPLLNPWSLGQGCPKMGQVRSPHTPSPARSHQNHRVRLLSTPCGQGAISNPKMISSPFDEGAP